MVLVIWMDALTGKKSWRKHADLVSLDGGGDLIERKVIPLHSDRGRGHSEHHGTV